MVAISEVSPIATTPITIASPTCTPAILVRAARVPCRKPLAITSVTTGPATAPARCRRRQRRDRLEGTWEGSMRIKRLHQCMRIGKWQAHVHLPRLSLYPCGSGCPGQARRMRGLIRAHGGRNRTHFAVHRRHHPVRPCRASPETPARRAARRVGRPCLAPPRPAGRSGATARSRWRCARAVGHIEIVAPRPARHVGDVHRFAGLARRKALADQIEIGDAVDLVVIGNAGVAIAEADLRPHIEFDILAAGLLAAEGAARRPAVARKRPGDLAPAERFRTEAC